MGAYTFLELLVSIAIVGLLLALLTPALARARYRAKETAEVGNLTNIARHIDIMMDQQVGVNGRIRTYHSRGYRVDPESLLNFTGVSSQGWKDPFRKEPVSRHPALGGAPPEGLGMHDMDLPEGGLGRVYLDLATRDHNDNYAMTGNQTNPVSRVNKMLNCSEGAEYCGIFSGGLFLIFSSGPDGVLDMDLHRDIVFGRSVVEGDYLGGFNETLQVTMTHER